MNSDISNAPLATAASKVVNACADELWVQLQAREPYYRNRAGLLIDQLPTGSLEEAEKESAASRQILGKLRSIDHAELSRSDQVTTKFLLHMAEEGKQVATEWWDSFPVTPYMAIIGLRAHFQHVFLSFKFNGAVDFERYLSLLSDYENLVRNCTEKVCLMAERGWRISCPALPGARKSIMGLRTAAPSALRPSSDRLGYASELPAGWIDRMEGLVKQIITAFDQLNSVFDGEYERHAPLVVGMMHQPGGAEAYDRAIRRHLTESVDPVQLHETGKGEVARITDAMAQLRGAQGWSRSEREFHDVLLHSPRSYAQSPEEVRMRYQSYIDRMVPWLPKLFHKLPSAPYDIARLAPEAEPGMTYGYYEAPAQAGDAGVYYYNGSDLDGRLQLTAASVILHELMPGHHFHISRQVENAGLPIIRREVTELSVFNEGWAEYAASLGVEAGVYDDPY
ncbi:MAG: DUF885 domain-containing protein, partial [Emcibacter sp.]|nr:DUF885 domain-containing protein [Emcibacter sp.]